jgi:serine/threonine protein kinase
MSRDADQQSPTFRWADPEGGLGSGPGPRFADYQILGLLGEGGMGSVYRARDSSGRDVALKVITNPTPHSRARFEREGQVTASLDHPGIVSVHSAGVFEGRLYLVYDLVEGSDLRERFKTLGRDALTKIVLQVAHALGHAHERGVLHRDLKADNILLDTNDVPRIADFGLALAVDFERLTQTGALVGTPMAMAPEQLAGKRDQYGPHTDVWALGILLYHSLTGQEAFGTSSTFVELMSAVVSAHIASPRSVDPSVPRAVEAVCMKALSKKPTDRHPDANAFAEDLARALSGSQPGKRSVGLFLVPVLAAAAVFVVLSLRENAEPAAPADASVPPVHAGATPEPPSPTRAPDPLVATALRVVASGDVSRSIVAVRAVSPEAPWSEDEIKLADETAGLAQASLDTQFDEGVTLLEALADTGLQVQNRRRGPALIGIAAVRVALGGFAAEQYWRLMLVASRLDLAISSPQFTALKEPGFLAARPWREGSRDPWKRYLDLRVRMELGARRNDALRELLLNDAPPIRLGPCHWADSASALAALKGARDPDALLHEAERRDPKSPYVQYRWANVRTREGRDEEALVHALRALEFFPFRATRANGSVTLRFMLQRVLKLQAGLGHRVAARETLTRLRGVGPNTAERMERAYPWLAGPPTAR